MKCLSMTTLWNTSRAIAKECIFVGIFIKVRFWNKNPLPEMGLEPGLEI